MDKLNQEQIDNVIKGRKYLDDFRKSHDALYSDKNDKKISEKHAPLQKSFEDSIMKLGFTNVQEFHTYNEVMLLTESGKGSEASEILADYATFLVEKEEII